MPKKERPPSDRPRGGQPGHSGHARPLQPSEEADEIVTCALPDHCVCGGELRLAKSYQRHQVYELPEMKLLLTEYRLEKGHCQRCQQKQIASLPTGVTWGITGPRLTSFMSELVSKYQLSRRGLQTFLKEHYRFHLSLGTVFNKQRLITRVLETPVVALLAEAVKSPCLNVDETSHVRDGKKQWTWGVFSTSVAYFSIQAGRGKKALRELLGEFKGIVSSDRYVAYTVFEADKRQVCWAHIKRDFTRLSQKRVSVIARLGKRLLTQERRLFELWGRFKRQEISREELREQCRPVQEKIRTYLAQGTHTDPLLKAARLCQNILTQFESLWTFLTEEGVEPTNNHAERCLRSLVIWRKRYFGTRSDYGSEFVARTSSILMTCQLQSRNAFEYFCQATQHYFAKQPVPTLVKA